MANIKNTFSTTEIAQIAGIKAHTIRIWEKRYNLFTPVKLARNIRHYSLVELRKLLNVALLQKKGYKISKIAALSDADIISMAKSHLECDIKSGWSLNQLKLSMYSFDTKQFDEVYSFLLKENKFSVVFAEVFIPFLEFIGDLWQTEAITPAHEHFISNLIYQKIQEQIGNLEVEENKDSPIYVLYLPEEEMHEIGLLYLNFDLKSRGYRTIYLGRSIPMENLETIKEMFPVVHWISVFTISLKPNYLKDYLMRMEQMLEGTNHQFFGVSRTSADVMQQKLSEKIRMYSGINQLIGHI